MDSSWRITMRIISESNILTAAVADSSSFSMNQMSIELSERGKEGRENHFY